MCTYTVYIPCSYICTCTLPEGEENDGLDSEKLEHRVEGSEEWLGGRVEQKEPIESDSDRYVVGYGAVEVSSSRTVRGGERHNVCACIHMVITCTV